MDELAKVSRFEVIDHTEGGEGRAFVKWRENLKVETSLQDNKRTLKVFITDTKAPISVNREEVNKLYALNLLNQTLEDKPDDELAYIVNRLTNYIGKDI